jgi:hypothetical protein
MLPAVSKSGEDEVLPRMLKTPPQPRAAGLKKKPSPPMRKAKKGG